MKYFEALNIPKGSTVVIDSLLPQVLQEDLSTYFLNHNNIFIHGSNVVPWERKENLERGEKCSLEILTKLYSNIFEISAKSFPPGVIELYEPFEKSENLTKDDKQFLGLARLFADLKIV
jgi:hypothetical protein